MLRIATALSVVLAMGALAAGPASAKRAQPRYDQFELTRAEGFVRVTFGGSEAAGCRAAGVCGVSGTIGYAFGGVPRDSYLVAFWRPHRRLETFGTFETDAATVADVGTAGSAERCVDRVAHEYDYVSFDRHRGRLRFSWRSVGGLLGGGDAEEGEEEDLADFVVDPLDTRCAGPGMVDLIRADALPVAYVPFRVLRSPRTSSFRVRGAKPFAGGGFAGTVDWDLRYRLRRR